MHSPPNWTYIFAFLRSKIRGFYSTSFHKSCPHRVATRFFQIPMSRGLMFRVDFSVDRMLWGCIYLGPMRENHCTYRHFPASGVPGSPIVPP